MELEVAEVRKEEFAEDQYCPPHPSPQQLCGLAKPKPRAAGGR